MVSYMPSKLDLQFPNELTDGHYRIFRGLIKSGDVKEIGQTESSAHFEALTKKGRIFFEWLGRTQKTALWVAR